MLHTPSVFCHYFIHTTAVHIPNLNILFHSYFDSLSDRVISILPLFIHRYEYGVPFAFILLGVRFL